MFDLGSFDLDLYQSYLNEYNLKYSPNLNLFEEILCELGSLLDYFESI